MRNSFLLNIFILISSTSFSQYMFSSEKINISTTYSQNKKCYIKSYSFDNEYPTLRGKSVIYKNDSILYTINRAFDLDEGFPFRLAISNDGATVAYFMDFTNSKIEEGKPVTVYKNGKFINGYSLKEFTGCDPEEERCALFYNNEKIVIDLEKSNYGASPYKKVFKTGTSDEEQFLNQNSFLINNDTVYLTDSRKIVTVYDLNTLSVIRHITFDSIYKYLKPFSNFPPEIEYVKSSYKYINDFTEKESGITVSDAIGKILNLKYFPLDSVRNNNYKFYHLGISGYLSKTGKFEIEKLESKDGLDLKEVEKYLSNKNFNADFLSDKIGKQYFQYFFGAYRNYKEDISIYEKKLEIEKEKKQLAIHLISDSIAGIYIPKNLEDCFFQLDNILKKPDKDEMKSLKQRFDMIKYHMGLGMWIRNNWGLWGGSRLQKYFRERGIGHPDSMSGIILDFYYDWLNGNKEIGKLWEKNMKKTKKISYW